LYPPREATSIAATPTTLVGTGLGASLALAIIVTGTNYLTRVREWNWVRLGGRILSSWIAASAILVLAVRFVRGQMF
jgi:hypothetical protein